VPYFIERTSGDGYRVIVHAALENFPGDSLEDDAIRINQLIEKQIRKAPETYLWTHRRFKTRPEGESGFY
jgi:KDO2-lipid IV(A) lauroyltransferase